MHRLVAAVFIPLSLSACATQSFEDDDAAMGGGELVELSEATAARVGALALEAPSTSALTTALLSEGCVELDVARITAVRFDERTEVSVEQRYDCGAVRIPNVVTVFELEPDVSWLSSHRIEVDPYTGAVDRVAVLSDEVVAERTPPIGEETPARDEVLGEGEARAFNCDAALIAASFFAMEDAIAQCGLGSYVIAIPGEVHYTAQLIGEQCVATTAQRYACH